MENHVEHPVQAELGAQGPQKARLLDFKIFQPHGQLRGLQQASPSEANRRDMVHGGVVLQEAIGKSTLSTLNKIS